MTFNLSKTNYGMSKTIERVQQRCMFREGTLEHQSTIQTIVLLDADDKIHINFPAHELAFVSRDYGAHALGMIKFQTVTRFQTNSDGKLISNHWPPFSFIT